MLLASQEHGELLRYHDSYLFHQVRLSWIKEMDVNKGFFHLCIKHRSRKKKYSCTKGRVGLAEEGERHVAEVYCLSA